MAAPTRLRREEFSLPTWSRPHNGQSAAAISRALERKNKTGVERIVVLDPDIRRIGGAKCQTLKSPAGAHA